MLSLLRSRGFKPVRLLAPNVVVVDDNKVVSIRPPTGILYRSHPSIPKVTQWFSDVTQEEITEAGLVTYLRDRYNITDSSQLRLVITEYVEHRFMYQCSHNELQEIFDDVFISLRHIHHRGYHHIGLEMDDILVTNKGPIICGHWIPSIDTEMKRNDMIRAGHLMYSLLVPFASEFNYSARMLFDGSRSTGPEYRGTESAIDIIRRNLKE